MYEFDLKTFVRIIVKSKKWIIINCCIAMGLAIVVAFSIPKEYSASVSLASESVSYTHLTLPTTSRV